MPPYSSALVTAWTARKAAHERRADALAAPHLERRRRGIRHPVEDFLFTYYSHRPAQLRRWHPGARVVLGDADPAALGRDYVAVDGGAALDTAAVVARRRDSLGWIRELLVRTAGRPAQFGCFGLHEWAMVYRADEFRHGSWPLRLGRAGTDAVVEEHAVRCSHYDAFRFFTTPARPHNALDPSRERQVELEQPGCLHANMDIYKWAYKLSPLVPGEIVVDAFELAREIRVLDMRASPYDLSDLGYDPLPIETAAGKAEYTAAQRAFAPRAAALRQQLADILGSISVETVERQM